MHAPRSRRSGLSLIELLVVITLLGIFATVVLMRFGRDTFADTGARGQARLVSLAMLHAQRAAIRTGDSHGVVFRGGTSKVDGWSVVHKLPDDRQVVIDGPHEIADGVKVAPNAAAIWFDFEGVGAQPFEATFRGKNRTYQVQVEPFTRMISTQEVGR